MYKEQELKKIAQKKDNETKIFKDNLQQRIKRAQEVLASLKPIDFSEDRLKALEAAVAELALQMEVQPK